MKTTITHSNVPNLKMIAINVTVVLAFCVLNCMAVNGQVYPERSTSLDMDPINNVMDQVHETELVLQDWMLNFASEEVGLLSQDELSFNHSDQERMDVMNSKPAPVISLRDENPVMVANNLVESPHFDTE